MTVTYHAMPKDVTPDSPRVLLLAFILGRSVDEKDREVNSLALPTRRKWRDDQEKAFPL